MLLINIRLNIIYKTCDKAILENGWTLKSVPDCYKNQWMGNKTVDNYLHALEFVPESWKTPKKCDKAVDTHPATIKFDRECYKTQEIRFRAVHRCFFVLEFIPDQYKTQEICDIAVFLHPFLIEYYPDKNIIQQMYDKAVDIL